jgi:hypothetical protein
MSVRRLDRPVLDFDFGSGHTDTLSADKVIAHVRDQGLQVEWILETHAHADHLWAAHYLQQKVGGRIAIGEHIRQVQATFKKLYNLERDFLPDGSQFDHLFQGRREVRHRRGRGHRAARSGAHAGRHGLPGRRCHVRRRHPVHAGPGIGPGWLLWSASSRKRPLLASRIEQGLSKGSARTVLSPSRCRVPTRHGQRSHVRSAPAARLDLDQPLAAMLFDQP